MKLLQLCNKPPLPQADGGTLAICAVTDGLLDAGCQVKLLSIATAKHPFVPGKIPDGWKKSTGIEAVFTDTRVRMLPALLNLFSSESYNIQRFYNPAFEERLVKILQQESFDIIHLESLFLTPYLPAIRRHSKAPVVLRAHNVEGLIWERLAQNEPAGLQKKYLVLLAKRLRQYEEKTIPLADGLVPISPEDAAFFGRLTNPEKIHVLPFAMPLPAYSETETLPFSVFHLGAMDWKPNAEGVNWLLHEVWPLVLRELPQAVLHLAGRGMTDELRNTKMNGLVVHGEVDDAHAFMRSCGVMAVPLLSGGGMRIKIVEGMALGKAIVSTGTGLEGSGAESGKQVIRADDAPAFAKALLDLLQQPEKIKQLGREARIFAAEHFDREKATAGLLAFYRALIEKKNKV